MAVQVYGVSRERVASSLIAHVPQFYLLCKGLLSLPCVLFLLDLGLSLFIRIHVEILEKSIFELLDYIFNISRHNGDEYHQRGDLL